MQQLPNVDEQLVEILQNALPCTYRLIQKEQQDSVGIRKSWIRGLRNAFHDYYRPYYASTPGLPRLAVFGGTPNQKGEGGGGTTGIKAWRRWEFLHDVTVVEWDYIEAGYAKHPDRSGSKRPVPIIKRAIWQVESEIAGNGSQVAEDISKLVVSSGENKLLIASQTQQTDKKPWLKFLGQAMSQVSDNAFVCLVPHYGSKQSAKAWTDNKVELSLYRIERGGNQLIEFGHAVSSEVG